MLNSALISLRVNFYPRPPRGGRLLNSALISLRVNFYPRPPRGGRLLLLFADSAVRWYFYPRPPRGGRPGALGKILLTVGISIHALREEGDRSLRPIQRPTALFLSTPSARRATPCTALPEDTWDISIHALREEGDHYVVYIVSRAKNFYPRPPRGGRLLVGILLPLAGKFLSTPSARRATWLACLRICPHKISIHALREEGDVSPDGDMDAGWKFLSTPSARRATNCARRPYHRARYFYPRPPRGGRPNGPKIWASTKPFLSTPSARRATAETRPNH